MESEEATEQEAAGDDRCSLKIDPETMRLLRRLCGPSYDDRSQAAEIRHLVRDRATLLGIPVPPVESNR